MQKFLKMVLTSDSLQEKDLPGGQAEICTTVFIPRRSVTRIFAVDSSKLK